MHQLDSHLKKRTESTTQHHHTTYYNTKRESVAEAFHKKKSHNHT